MKRANTNMESASYHTMGMRGRYDVWRTVDGLDYTVEHLSMRGARARGRDRCVVLKVDGVGVPTLQKSANAAKAIEDGRYLKTSFVSPRTRSTQVRAYGARVQGRR